MTLVHTRSSAEILVTPSSNGEVRSGAAAADGPLSPIQFGGVQSEKSQAQTSALPTGSVGSWITTRSSDDRQHRERVVRDQTSSIDTQTTSETSSYGYAL